MKWFLWGTGLLMLALCGGARGDMLRDAPIAPDACYAAYLDVSFLAQSPFGGLLSRHLNESPFGNQLDAFEQTTHFNPRRDLDAIYIYGRTEREQDAVCLLYGRFDTEHLLSLLRKQPGYRLLNKADTPVHAWMTEESGDHETIIYSHFHESGPMLFSRSHDELLHAIKRIHGHALSGNDGQTALAPASGPRPFFSAQVSGMGLQAVPAQAAVLRNSEYIGLELSGEGETLHGRISLISADESTAKSIHHILQGMIGILLLQAESNPELAAVARRMRLTQKEHQVLIRMQVSLDQARAFLDGALRESGVEEWLSYP